MASGPHVRNAVRKLLQSSPSYRELPPDRQREIAHNTTRVASYMADPHGLLSKKPRARAEDAQARQPRAATALASRRGARARGPGAAHLAVLRDARVVDASAAAEALLQTIDFPDFVGQAREWLAQRFAVQLEFDPRGRLHWRVEPQVGARDIASALSMSSVAAHARDLVTAARRRMAVDRQQLLATVVMMGINRVVVTDGKISARAGRANQ